MGDRYRAENAMTDTDERSSASDRDQRYEQYREEFLANESTIYCASYFYFAVAALVAANAWLIEFDESISRVLLAVAGISVWVGIGLRRLDPSARTGAAIISICSIASNWQSVIFHGYFLFHLFSGNGSFVFSDEYRRAVRHTPKTSPKVRWFPVLVTSVFAFLVGWVVVELTDF